MTNKFHNPNILMIVTDQQRYDSLGTTGHPQIKTPNLDELAAKGIQFTSAYTPFPTCCPARQTLLSGIMPEQHGGLWNYDSSLPVNEFSPALPIWVKQLKQLGYHTSYFGKWHVHKTLDPTHFGFDVFEEPGNDNFSTPYQETKYPVSTNPWPQFPIGNYESISTEESHTHVLAKMCIEQIEKNKNTHTPWHIRLDFSEPHLPCVPTEPYASMYPPHLIEPWGNFDESFTNKPYIQLQQIKNWNIEHWTWHEWSIYLSGYFGIISQVDDAIGRVIRLLESQDLMRNTLIIYTTDHGDAAGSHRMMDKHYVLYEEETHVPMIIRWDGVIDPGSKCHDFVSHFLDLPVTILDLLQLPIPETYQGRSFLRQLQGYASNNPWHFAFSSYNGQQFGLYCQRMVRDRRYKYIWNATDTDELYDLEQDPFELNNLAFGNEESELCKTYRKHVYHVFEKLKDPLVTGNWIKNWLLGTPVYRNQNSPHESGENQ